MDTLASLLEYFAPSMSDLPAAVNALFWLLRITTMSALGLAAIWAARSPRHWFVRASGIAALLAFTLPIAAYDLLIMLLVQAVVVIAALRSAAWYLRKGRVGLQIRPTFSLLDILLMTVLAAAVVWVDVRVPTDAWQQWKYLVNYGLAHAFVTLVAYALVAPRRRPGRRTAAARREERASMVDRC